jgi:hypothetical protein
MTNAATHTPGPWCYFENNEGYSVRQDSTGEHVAYCDRDIDCDDMDIDGACPAEANARLIAAAPNLLESAERALLALQGNYDSYDNCEWHDADSWDAYIALHDAIDMAKGGRK